MLVAHHGRRAGIPHAGSFFKHRKEDLLFDLDVMTQTQNKLCKMSLNATAVASLNSQYAILPELLTTYIHQELERAGSTIRRAFSAAVRFHSALPFP